MSFSRAGRGRKKKNNNFRANQNGPTFAKTKDETSMDEGSSAVPQAKPGDNKSNVTKPAFVLNKSEAATNPQISNSQVKSGKKRERPQNDPKNDTAVPQKVKEVKPFWTPEEVKASLSKLANQGPSNNTSTYPYFLWGSKQKSHKNSSETMEVDVSRAEVRTTDVIQAWQLGKQKPFVAEELEIMESEETNIIVQYIAQEPNTVQYIAQEPNTVQYIAQEPNTVQEIELMEAEEQVIVDNNNKILAIQKGEQMTVKTNEFELRTVNEIDSNQVLKVNIAYREPFSTFKVRQEVLSEVYDKDYSGESDHDFKKLMDDLSCLMSNLISPEKSKTQISRNLFDNVMVPQFQKENEVANTERVQVSKPEKSQPLTEIISEEIKTLPEDLDLKADECKTVEDAEKETKTFDAVSQEADIRLQEEELERTKFCWSPLNICQMVEDRVTVEGEINPDERMFWKLVISLPSEGSILHCDPGRFTKWLARKFSLNASEEQLPEDGQELCLGRTLRVPMGQGKLSMDVFIRSCRDNSNHKLTMQGVSSVLFYLRDHSETCNLQRLIEEESERLSAMLGDRPFMPPPTLTIIGSKNQSLTTEYLVQSLRLTSYVEKDIIHSFDVVLSKDVWQRETSNELKQCISSMLNKMSPPPPICTQPIFDFFEKYLNKFFSHPLIHDDQKRQCDLTKNYEPSNLINMYNEVASWLINKVTDASVYGSIAWPPSEACFVDKQLPPPLWNSKNRLEALGSYFEDIILLLRFPVTEGLSFDEACTALDNYIEEIAERCSTRKLISIVDDILEKAEHQPRSRKRSRDAGSPPRLSGSIIPWASVLTALVDFQLSNLCGLKDLKFDRLLTVSYFKDLMTDAPKFPPLSKSRESPESDVPIDSSDEEESGNSSDKIEDDEDDASLIKYSGRHLEGLTEEVANGVEPKNKKSKIR